MSSTETSLTPIPPAGMRDFLPGEVALRDWATAQLMRVYEQFGFTKIETPALENIANLRGGEGGENLQLIFEVLKRGDKLGKVLSQSSLDRNELADLGLRFDLTVPLVRFFAHNQANLPNPFKTIQTGSVWRAESPQQGRFRQFTQCDIDIFGIKSEVAEMELIQATSEALLSLGFSDFTVRINDRRVLASLVEYCGFAPDAYENLFIQIDKLDKIGLTGVHKELLNNGHDTKAIAPLLAFLAKVAAPQAQSFESSLPPNIEADVKTGLGNILQAIKQVANGRYGIHFDPTLVRGMGYYTGPIFEIVCKGYPYSIAGGGRYDKMVGKMTGRDVAAVGFSIGFERIISILMDKGAKPNSEHKRVAVLFDTQNDSAAQVLQAADKLRKTHIVSLQPKKKDMRKQLDALLASGFSAYSVFKADGGDLELRQFENSST